MKTPEEEEAESFYHKTLATITSVMGDSVTSNTQLDAAGKKFVRNYRGTFPRDLMPTLLDGESCIINTDKSGQTGTHWLAVTRNNGALYGYDSFGRTINRIAKTHRDIANDTHDKEQLDREENCGQRCISWLLCVQSLGIKKALLI